MFVEIVWKTMATGNHFVRAAFILDFLVLVE